MTLDVRGSIPGIDILEQKKLYAQNREKNKFGTISFLRFFFFEKSGQLATKNTVCILYIYREKNNVQVRVVQCVATVALERVRAVPREAVIAQ